MTARWSFPRLASICCLLALLLGTHLPRCVDALLPLDQQQQPTPAPPTPSPHTISPHDRICRNYLKTFLKGITDSRDECQGLQNAYAAGDCRADENDDNGGGDDDGYNPWRRWWHDLFGDDDFSTDDDEDSGGDPGYIYGHRMLYNDDRGDNAAAKDDDDQVTMIDDTYENYVCCSTIRSYYTVRCPNTTAKVIDPTILLLIASILIACGVVKSIIRSMDNAFVRSMPEAAGCILVGAAAGIIVRIAVPGIDLDRVAFDEDLFLSIFLPPIIFQATLAIDKGALGRNIGPVAAFAVGGTFISALLTGGMLFVATRLTSTPIPGLDSTIFGALISSIDPVATLSVLSAVGIGESETIYVLVFGESLLNDGVAIVLFKTLLEHLDGRGWADDESVASFVGVVAQKFCVVTVGSIGIGLVSGVACTLYFWSLSGRHVPVVEVGIFFIWALVPYYVGDAVGYSSVISMMATLFFADVFVIGRHSNRSSSSSSGGLPTSNVAEHSSNTGEHETSFHSTATQGVVATRREPLFSTAGQLSSISRQHIGFVAEVVSSLMETIIFAYLGLFLFTNKHHDVPLSIIAILSCVGSRAIMVGSLSWALNALRLVYNKSRQCCCNNRRVISVDDDDGYGNSAPEEEERQQQGQETEFIDRRMQRVLFLSGIRGAVSLALVENIPLYNAVTKEGSKFKAELKTMTISSIIFTVFAFGSATYNFMKNDGISTSTTRRTRRQQNEQGGLSSRLNEPLLSGEEAAHVDLLLDEDAGDVEIDHAL